MNEEVKTMSSEERIKALEDRVATLELIEKRRKTKRLIMIGIKVFVYIIIIIMLVKLYLFVKPYFEQLMHIGDLKNSLNLGGDSSTGFDLSNFDLSSLFQ